MLARSVVIHHEQHIGIALGPTGEFRQRRHIAVPHGTRRDSRQELRHVVGRVHQALFERAPQLLLLFFQARGQTGSQSFASTGRKAVQAAFDFTSGLLKLTRKRLAVSAKAHG